MKAVAISGCTGAIGVALINKCIENNVKVIAYVRPDSKRRDNIPKHDLVKISDYDISEFAKMSRLSGMLKLPEVDAFYHLAWAGTKGEGRDDTELQNANIKYTLDAVKLAHAMKAGVFIGAGSYDEYGQTQGVLTPDTPADPDTACGTAKLCAGGLSRIMCSQLKIKHVWTRILNVYGPYDNEDSVIMYVIRKLLNGECPAVSDDMLTWDCLYSTDAADALYRIAKRSELKPYSDKDREGKVYCLGLGQAMSVKEQLKIIEDMVAHELKSPFAGVPWQGDRVMNLTADITQLKQDTGFVPKTSFADGIRATIDYCMA